MTPQLQLEAQTVAHFSSMRMEEVPHFAHDSCTNPHFRQVIGKTSIALEISIQGHTSKTLVYTTFALSHFFVTLESSISWNETHHTLRAHQRYISFVILVRNMANWH